MNWTDKITVYNQDCMEALKGFPDNHFNLSIVDPPYGVDISKKKIGYSIASKLKTNTNWDDQIPEPEYFTELFRVSRYQIIWGGNCFGLPKNKGFVIWDKKNEGRNFSEIEYAWSNIGMIPRKFTFGVLNSNPNRDKTKIHPCQKPIKLYEWLLMNYAQQDINILDTHLGSGSHAIACYNLGFNLTAYEIDTDYYEAAHKRFKLVTSQTTIFDE